MTSNIKDSQKRDNYIKELIENKKMITLNQEKVLKGIHDQVVTILPLLSQLWSTFFYIRNIVAKAPGLSLGKKLSNSLSNYEVLNL